MGFEPRGSLLLQGTRQQEHEKVNRLSHAGSRDEKRRGTVDTIEQPVVLCVGFDEQCWAIAGIRGQREEVSKGPVSRSFMFGSLEPRSGIRDRQRGPHQGASVAVRCRTVRSEARSAKQFGDFGFEEAARRRVDTEALSQLRELSGSS